MTGLGNIAAVLVTLNPPAEIEQTVASIIDSANHIFIVDNGSDPNAIATLEVIAKNASDKITLIQNGDNLGLAKAQNIGIEKALEYEAKWVLLLDDDSECDSGMLPAMAEALFAHPKPNNIAIIAPVIRDRNTPERIQPYICPRGGLLFKRSLPQTPYLDNVLTVIASGSLINANALNDAGFLREDFFIDYVDTEFCLRLVEKNWEIIVAGSAILHHAVGQKHSINLLGFKIYPSNHSPERRFTIYRNRVRVWKLYRTTVPQYILYDMLAASFDLWRILLFETGKWPKFRQAFRGLLAAIKEPSVRS